MASELANSPGGKPSVECSGGAATPTSGTTFDVVSVVLTAADVEPMASEPE